MRLTSEEKGISATRGNSRRSASGSNPAFRPNTRRAPSVGSPRTVQSPSVSSRAASLHNMAIRAISASTGWSPGLTAASPIANDPEGSYPEPLTSTISPSRKRRRTVISFFVRVPVLSVQITVVQPMVSTAGRRLTMAFFRAMRVVPMARAPVTTAGRDSGTAATARLIPQISISSQRWPRQTPRTEAPTATVRQITDKTRPMVAMRASRGVCPRSRPPTSGRSCRTPCPCRWR